MKHQVDARILQCLAVRHVNIASDRVRLQWRTRPYCSGFSGEALRMTDAYSDIPELADLEDRLTEEANQMGIGPMGFGGNTTVLGTKITTLNRLPASYFVSVSYMCWAYRRRKMVITEDGATYS